MPLKQVVTYSGEIDPERDIALEVRQNSQQKMVYPIGHAKAGTPVPVDSRGVPLVADTHTFATFPDQPVMAVKIQLEDGSAVSFEETADAMKAKSYEVVVRQLAQAFADKHPQVTIKKP